MSNQHRPATSEAMMIAGVAIIILGAALFGTVIAELIMAEQRQANSTVVLLVAMTGLATFVLGVLLISNSSIIWRLDRIEQGDTMRAVEDEDVIPLKRRI
jgi:uncharacterized membrane protein